MVLEAHAPSLDSSPFVEEHPEEGASSSQDQVEGAVPVHGLRVVKVADPAADCVLGSLTSVAAVVLSVTHTSCRLFKFLLKL